MVILCAILEYPLQKTVHGIVGIVERYAHLLDGHLCGLAVLQQKEDFVERAIVAEALLQVLLQIQTHKREVTLQMTALQVEDVRQGVERHTQRILRDGSVQEEVVARNALASEAAAFLAEVMGERRGYRRGVATAIYNDGLKSFVLLHILIEVVIEEEELLQLLGVQVFAFEQACCLRTAGSDRQHSRLSEINYMAKEFFVVVPIVRDSDIQVDVILIS